MGVLLLDIGGVFFFPAWRLRGIREVSKKLHIQKKDFKQALQKYKRPFYTGKISEIEYWKQVLRELSVQKVKPSELKKLYRSYVQPIPKTLDLLPRLSSRFTLVSCNNSPKEWMDYRIKIASLDKYFSSFFTSGYIGFMKPEEKMYLKILKFYNNDDLLYFDDDEEYISIARDKYGIPSQVYHGYKDLQQLVK